MAQPRILILSAKFGEGHYQVGEALANALALKSSGKALVSHLDCGSFFFKKTDYLIKTAYLKMVNKTPEIWRLLYEKTLDLTMDNWRMVLYGLGAKNLLHFIREYNPDVIINTHFIPAGILADLKRQGQLKVPLITAVTDYFVHGVWIHPGVDYYLASCRDVFHRLRKAGIAADRINLTGIPLRNTFEHPLLKSVAREKLGLKQDVQTILIMGGSSGLAGKETEVMESIHSITQEAAVQFLVVCGRDRVSYEKFSIGLRDLENRSLVMGYVPNMEEMMAASDLLVSKGGALTISEALTVGLPLLMYKPIPGHEDGNASFVQDGGAGRKVKSPQELSESVLELLADSKKLEEMGQSGRKLLVPDSADQAAQSILRLIQGLYAPAPVRNKAII